MLASLILPAIEYGPELITDAETVFNNIAKGEGGIQKIEKIVGSLAKLLEAAVGAGGSAGVVSAKTANAVTSAVATVAGAVSTAVSTLQSSDSKSISVSTSANILNAAELKSVTPPSR